MHEESMDYLGTIESYEVNYMGSERFLYQSVRLHNASNECREGIAAFKTQRITSFLLVCILVTGCAGRAAAPVMVHQYGDERKSCKALEREISFTESEMTRLIPETEKTGKNVALGVAGIFFLVPWFFMDLSKAEQMEVNALRQRYNHLIILAGEKNCGIENEEIPDFKKKEAPATIEENE